MAPSRIFSLAVIVVVCLVTSSPGAHAADDHYAIFMPGRYEVAPSKAAPDIMLSLVATVRALRGERDLGKGVGAVQFARDAKVVAGDKLQQDNPFTYEGYALASVRLHRLEPSAFAPQGRRLMGVLQFVNASKLRAETAFQIDYTTGAQGLTIHELQTMAVTPLDTRVVLRVLPLATGEALMRRKPGTIEALLQQTLAAKTALPQNGGDWMLIAISPDRVLPGDRLEIQVGDRAGAAGSAVTMPVTFDYAGFAVAAMPWKATTSPAVANIYLHTDMHPDRSDGRRLLGSVPLTIAAAAPAAKPQAPPATPRPPAALAQETWQRVKAFGVEFEVPARWKRINISKPSSDHDESQFAQNPRDVAAGAWFSVFPNNEDLIDPERKEQPIVLDGQNALLSDILTRAEDPPPRRRQVVIYLADKRGPAFLFDGDEDKWSSLGPILDHIRASIRLPKK